ncbi:unnamed protein product [Chrysoparadoxa australica]
MTSYKEEKEAFISNLEGTTVSEVILVVCPLPASLWLLAELKGTLQCYNLSPPKSLVLVLEFACLVGPQLLSLLRPEVAPHLLLLLVLASLALKHEWLGLSSPPAMPTKQPASAKAEPSRRQRQRQWEGEKADALQSPRGKPFLTNYRAAVMMLTCITILAVDFPAFPRRLAKTELLGTGLMDLGVGAIMFTTGIVTGFAGGSERIGRPDLTQQLMRQAWSSWPLLLLGLGRMLFVKMAGYQEHVTEYGVHWNFFVTLICVRLALVLIKCLLATRQAVVAALACMVAYQWLLCRDGGRLTEWVVSGPRDSFFAQNREGFIGILGFTSILLLAEEVGSLCVRAVGAPSGRRIKADQLWGAWGKGLACLSLLAFISGALMLAAEMAAQQASRRLVNLAYVFWCTGHSSLLLAQLLAVDLVASFPPSSLLCAAVSNNMLPTFLAANVATGAVNMTMHTLWASDGTAAVVLTMYMAIVCGAALAAQAFKSQRRSSREPAP